MKVFMILIIILQHTGISNHHIIHFKYSYYYYLKNLFFQLSLNKAKKNKMRKRKLFIALNLKNNK